MMRVLWPILMWASAAAGPTGYPGLRCSFEDLCAWRWNASDWEVSGVGAPLGNYSLGPSVDADESTNGHFLMTVLRRPREVRVWSPKYVGTRELCRLELFTHMHNMDSGLFKVVVDTVNSKNVTLASWVLGERTGSTSRTWERISFNVGRIKQEFNIIIEVIPGDQYPSHVALDNIRLVDCFPERKPEGCLVSQFHCINSSKCIDHQQVCDMSLDCPDGSDEQQNCDDINIEGSRCNFEGGMCGWRNEDDNWMNWTLHSGPTETDHTGPSYDHTFRNATGKYIYVEMSGSARLGTASILISPQFNPPPPIVSNMSSRHYNACYVSFYYHQYGPHSGSLTLMLKEQYHSHVRELWRSFGDQGNVWKRVIRPLPPISQRYILFFEAKKSYSMRGDVAMDDFAMSPQCFGMGDFAKDELKNYFYPTAGSSYDPTGNGVVHPAFRNKTYYLFTSCGTNGTTGPTQENCNNEYNDTNVNVTVLSERTFAGVQKWTVPEDGVYTIIAIGAGGGLGAGGHGVSKGAEARLVIELLMNKDVYILVGQQGTSSSKKYMLSRPSSPPLSGPKAFGKPSPMERLKQMRKEENGGSLGRSNEGILVHNSSKGNTQTKSRLSETLTKIKTITVLGGGGGGGGGSYVFYMTKNKERVPLLVGAGGGGLAHGPSVDDGSQHGNEPDKNNRNQTGDAFGEAPAGAGGGWLSGNYTYRDTTGLALMQGATGGSGCVEAFLGHGGFGGGGGGCTAGGGGGGFSGGRAWSDKGRNGEGGYSFFGANGTLGHVVKGASTGDGKVLIIPAVKGCGCDYRCVALDVHRSATMCICPAGWILKNQTACVLHPSPDEGWFISIPQSILAGIVFLLMALFVGVITFSFYKRLTGKAEKSSLVTHSGASSQLKLVQLQSS